MKKVISVKEILIMLISIVLITVSTTAFATDLVLGGDNNAKPITGNEYDNAQVPQQNNTTNGNNTTGNNTTKKYNTTNNTSLPQTGVEDYNIGILLIVCIGSAIFAYKKITDYKNI